MMSKAQIRDTKRRTREHVRKMQMIHKKVH